MNILFVAQSFDYTYLDSDARRIDISVEHHDPLAGVASFHNLFDRIDDKGKREFLRLDSVSIKKAFWDRDEFLAALRKSLDDVYVQSSDYYSMRLMFLNTKDHDNFVERMAVPKVGYAVTFHNTLHQEILNFLRVQTDKSDYEVALSGDDHIYNCRDETISNLLRIKFCFTKQGDHSKPVPSIEDAYAAVAHIPMTPPPVVMNG